MIRTTKTFLFPVTHLLVITLISMAALATCSKPAMAQATAAQIEDAFYLCLRDKFKNTRRDISDHTHAFDPDSGRNFHYDRDKQAWIDSKTGESICPKVPGDAAIEDIFYLCLRDKFKNTRRDISDHTHAFDPDSGRNFHYDKDMKAWIDSKTGETICPKATAAPRAATPTGTAHKVSYELGLGYQFTGADEDTESFGLNGLYATAKVNLSPRFGIIADVSDTSGSKNGVGLRRDLFLIGPEFSMHSDHKLSLFAHSLIGLAHDRSSSGAFVSNNDALALTLGGAMQYRLGKSISLRVQADYVPTHFGASWQHNYRFTAGVVFGFGRK